MSIQFKKRSGSTIREININAVKEMLKKGMAEKDIMTLLAMSFCPDTRTDYLNTAKEKLEMENSATNLKAKEPQPQQKSLDYKCKNCKKPIPDNTTFCSKDCVEQYKKENDKQ